MRSLLAIFLVLGSFYCGPFGAKSPDELRPRPDYRQLQAVKIVDVAFHAWWWSDEQIRAGIDGDAPPAKSTYVKLSRWQHDAEPGTADPDRIDIVATIENQGNVDTRAEIECEVSFRIADYKLMFPTVADGKSIDEVVKDIPWTEGMVLDGQAIDIPKTSKKVVIFRDFELRKQIDRINSQNDALWPWMIRVDIRVKDAGGNVVHNYTANLDVVPNL